MTGSEYENHALLDNNLDVVYAGAQSSMHTKINGASKYNASNGMDASGAFLKTSFNMKEHCRHRPLTCWRLLRGFVCAAILVFTAFMTLIYFAPPAFVFLRLCSIHYSRNVVAFLFGHWLAMWPFFFEKINGTKVIFSGDKVPPKERVLLISNHRTEVDWMYIWNLALRKDRLGYIKYILKSSVRNVPIFGWGFHVLEFILVERQWKRDKPVIESMISSFKDPQDPLWLVLFPEGTDFTEKKCMKSQEDAVKDNRPILKNVLLPKSKGFHTCLTLLRNSLDAVYDVTIAYKHRLPDLKDNIMGTDPDEVHIHVRRLDPSQIPCTEAETSTWLDDSFTLKDELLSGFYKEGNFPCPVQENGLPTIQYAFNFLFMTGLAIMFSFLVFSSVWMKLYVCASCIYLAAATALGSRPSQIFGSLVKRKTHLKSL